MPNKGFERPYPHDGDDEKLVDLSYQLAPRGNARITAADMAQAAAEGAVEALPKSALPGLWQGGQSPVEVERQADKRWRAAAQVVANRRAARRVVTSDSIREKLNG